MANRKSSTDAETEEAAAAVSSETEVTSEATDESAVEAADGGMESGDAASEEAEDATDAEASARADGVEESEDSTGEEQEGAAAEADADAEAGDDDRTDTDATDTPEADAEEASEAEDATSETEADSAPVAATPSTMDHPEQAQSGSGFVPLAFGGIVAGAIGFAGGYFFDLNAGDAVGDLTGSLETQSAEIASLTEQAAGLEAAIAAIAPPADLTGVEGGISDLGGRLDEIGTALSAIEARVEQVEARPVFTGEAGADEAAIAGAIEQLRQDLVSQQEENAILAEDIQAMAEDAAARIAAAEERAEAAVGTATAQAAISELRIAIASGSPFASPLAEVAETQGLEIPDAISAVAETGVPTLAEIEAGFPAAARAALPVALQANAGEGAGERLTAFLRSQVGGRALSPQPGDDPDAVLSRAGAAVGSGDLTTALQELTALPDPALEVMADWIGQAASRMDALAALDGLAGALGNE